MYTSVTDRPRNVNSIRAAGLLYGNLGASKAYVLGIAFSIAGYRAFWYILGVSILLVLIGINYVTICKCYPHGGGVYSSVRNRSHVFALIGALFILVDYLVTASLSCLSAFYYLNVAHPVLWAASTIGVIGLLNLLGPKYTGNLAAMISFVTVSVLSVVVILCLPFLKEGWMQLQPMTHHVWPNWSIFVSVIVALSGVEAIANATGIMQLDPGSTPEFPVVSKTAKKALFLVVTEVAVFTAVFSLAATALPNLIFSHEDVLADGVSVRDNMIRYLTTFFSSQIVGVTLGHLLGLVVGIVLCALLLSSVNTAVVSIVALLYVLSNDGEMPKRFERLNRFGVPVWPLLYAVACPMLLVLLIHDTIGLAHLYAIGFVGAIAINLIGTSTNFHLAIGQWTRTLMGFTFLIMAGIEITLMIVKPQGTFYLLIILFSGLLLRALFRERQERQESELEQQESKLVKLPQDAPAVVCFAKNIRGIALGYKIAQGLKMPFYLIYIQEQMVVMHRNISHSKHRDTQALQFFERVETELPVLKDHFFSAVTDSLPHAIAKYSAILKGSIVMIEEKPFLWPHKRIAHELKALLHPDVQIIVVQ